MPCNCDHMEPTLHEAESKLVATHLKYVYKNLGQSIPKFVTEAASNSYGNVELVHEMTEMLCDACGTMSKKEQDAIIYNGRNARARKLADWWEKHQAADQLKRDKERGKALREGERKAALQKLTDREKELLGID